ncbi:O-antigen ligase family protein, partial [Candidatus Sumerlaeota bacterium]|nr:O-antigen ligase family protein [Candidatus Sumerlaeota bacterium]
YRRLQSLFWHSGWFGQYLAAVAPATLAFAAVEKNIRRRAAWLALAGFLGFTQLLTMQRGEWLAFLAGCAAIGGSLILASAGDSRRKIIRRAIAVAGGAFLFVFLLAAAHTPLRHRIGEMVQVRDRWTIWSGGLHLAGKFPSAGIGLGNYSVMHHVSFDEDNPLSLADDRTTAHNVYIHVFAERGIYAILFFLLLFWGTIWSLLRTSVAGGGTGFERAERLALLGGLTALAVDGVFQYTFYIRMTEVLFWIFLAFALPRSAKCDLPGFIPRRAARIWALIGIAIFSYLIYYQRFYFHYLNRVNGGEEGIFKVAGSEVSLPLPRDAHHISLRVISKDPSLPQDAVTFAFWIGDQLIATQVLHDHTAVDVPLPLPAGRDPAIPLTIKSSRAWRPYEQSFRRLPIVEAGVCYQDPRVVD